MVVTMRINKERMMVKNAEAFDDWRKEMVRIMDDLVFNQMIVSGCLMERTLPRDNPNETRKVGTKVQTPPLVRVS
jgi:hypothetical protein